MKKILFATLLLVCSFSSFAKVSQNNYATSVSSDIVTPDLATGVRKWSAWRNDTKGEMVVCTWQNYSSRSDTCSGGWLNIKSTVPEGRIFVGFRIVYQGSSSDYLEVYWK